MVAGSRGRGGGVVVAVVLAGLTRPGPRHAPPSSSRRRPTACRLRSFRTCPTVIVTVVKKGERSPQSITDHRVPELIPVLDSHPAGDVSHKPGGRLPLLSARPAVTAATLKRAATSFAAW